MIKTWRFAQGAGKTAITIISRTDLIAHGCWLLALKIKIDTGRIRSIRIGDEQRSFDRISVLSLQRFDFFVRLFLCVLIIKVLRIRLRGQHGKSHLDASVPAPQAIQPDPKCCRTKQRRPNIFLSHT